MSEINGTSTPRNLSDLIKTISNISVTGILLLVLVGNYFFVDWLLDQFDKQQIYQRELENESHDFRKRQLELMEELSKMDMALKKSNEDLLLELRRKNINQ